MMTDLTTKINLKKSQAYSQPRRQNQSLPLVYGDMTLGGEGGLWQAVCIDKEARVYALAGHPVLSKAQGNQVTVYGKEGNELGPGYTFNPDHNYQGKGGIATITFPKVSGSDISASASDSSFNSTDSGFASLGAGWHITVDGFSSSKNNKDFIIESASPSKIVVKEAELADEAAGREVTINADQKKLEPLGFRAKGKATDGVLIENPVLIVKDLLNSVCALDESELDLTSFSRAWARAEELGYAAAGVVERPLSGGALLTEVLGCFLGSWWRTASGSIKLMLDLGPGAADEAELAVSIRGSNLRSVKVSANLKDVINLVEPLYRYNIINKQFEGADEGAAAAHRASQGLYGERSVELELKWVRKGSTAATLASRLVNLLAYPRRLITCEENALSNLALEKGDPALFSLAWLYDREGLSLRNQIVRVMSIEPAWDKGVIRFQFLDTGFYKTLAYLADGTYPAKGEVQAGGQRDKREF